MAKASPKEKILSIVSISGDGKWKEQIPEAKGKLVRELAQYLEPRGGESVEEMQARLLGGQDGKGGISNKKLLKLHSLVQRLKGDFGGKKENIVNALMETQRGKEGKVNEDYRVHLQRKSIATLMHQYDHAKKAGRIA
ncbi:MAG: hypothetical protein H6727_01450 [Myxococcales bacterium]|nr:hypothetical protein [Myxococcales bacterium]